MSKNPESGLKGRALSLKEAEVLWALTTSLKQLSQNAEHSALLLMTSLSSVDGRDHVFGTGSGAEEFTQGLRRELGDINSQMTTITLLMAEGVEGMKKRWDYDRPLAAGGAV